MKSPRSTFKNLNQSRGQIVVEYILLLMVGVMMATLIASLLVSRNDDRPGILTQKWRAIIETIAQDTIDK